MRYHRREEVVPMVMTTGRPPTLSTRGMVTCPHALASQAGVDVLRAGGSAVDAAIAASATLGVVYPHMCGIGGDAYWLIYNARAREVSCLEGGGRAASSARLEWFRENGHGEIPFRGVLPATLTTPGSVASWCEAHARFGKLAMERNLESAIHYARDGYPVTERLARWIAEVKAELAQHRDSAALFMPGGEPARAGTKLANAGLARTLESIALAGRAGFYEGEVAAELSRFAKERGGFFREEDLAAQASTWAEPLRGTYRGITLFETPAPTQGFTVLEMLNLLEPLEVASKAFLGPDHVHLLVQAKQLAYHDRDRWLADPRFAEVPMAMLVSKDYAGKRRSLIDPARALPWDKVPSYGSLQGDTVYVAAVDAEGNAASLIFSLYGVFGSAVTAGGTGVVLQNRGAYFSLDPGHPNRVEPGKVPLHTLIASLAMREDRLWAVLGCMGADGQPQIHLQTYIAMVDFGCNIQEALEAPRWLSGRFALGEARDTLNIEARFPEKTIDELARRGHHVNRWEDWAELAGHAHGITLDPASGVLSGGSDPRSDGAAIGY
jgi:gamma-glutamyltranspeptidase